MDPFDQELAAHFEYNKLPGWERMQYKAFRAWTNHKLAVRKWKPAAYLEDVFEDGFTLITLLEILSGKDVVPAGQKTTKNPSFRIQKIGNNNFNFTFMKKEGIRLENMHSEDIVDKNRKLILGLIWTLILHYQLAFTKSAGGESGPKKELLELVRALLKPYNLPLDNFDNNWQDGRAFCALIAQHDPTLLDYGKITPANAKENLEKAFAILEKKKDIPRMLDPNDVISQKPDEKAIITYLAMILPVLTPVEKMPANSTLVSNPAEISPFEPGKQEPTFAIRSCHAGSSLFEAELVGPAGQIPVVVRDNGDKSYAIIPQHPYTTPGIYTLSAYFQKAHIARSPMRFTVLGGGPVRESDAGALFLPSKAGPATASTLIVFPLTDTFRPPEQNPSFVIEPRNANNQPIRTGGHRDQFSASITGPENIPVQIVDRPDGTYGINALKPFTVAGRYKLQALCNGFDITGSPFYFNVVLPTPVKAGPSAPNSNLQVTPRAESYVAPTGTPQFAVLLRDTDNKPLPGAASALSASLTGPENIPCSVTDTGAGTYAVVLHKPIALPGRYKLSVLCNGADINGSPFYFNITLPVKAGPSAPNSTLQVTPVADSYIAPAGVPQFVVLLRDTDKKPVSGAASVLYAAITGPENIPCTVNDSGAGTYVIVLSKPVSLAGRYKLEVLCNGEPVAQSPFYFVIVLLPSPYTSEVSPLGTIAETYTVPTTTPQFALQLRDLNKQPVAAQGEALSAQLTGPESIQCSVVEKPGVGVYHIIFAKPFTVGGRYQLDVYIGKAHVKGSPCFFNVIIKVQEDESREFNLALAPRSPPPAKKESSLNELDDLYLTLTSPNGKSKKDAEEAERKKREAAEADAKIAARKAEEARKAAEAKTRAEEEERARARAAIEESARKRERAAAEEAEKARQRAVEEEKEKARQRAVAEEAERKRRAAEEELAVKARSPPPQDDLELLIGDLASSNKKPLTAAASTPAPTVYTINVKFSSFQPQDAGRALDDPVVYTLLVEHQPLVLSLKEQLNAVPVSTGRPADMSALKRNIYEIESEEDAIKNLVIVVFRTRTIDIPLVLRLLVSVVRAAKVVIDSAPANKRDHGVRAVQQFVLTVLRFVVVVSNLKYASEPEFQSAVNPVAKDVNDSYRALLSWLQSLQFVQPPAAPMSPPSASSSPQLPVVFVSFRQTFDIVLDTLPSSQQALLVYNWRDVDEVFRVVASILRQLHPRLSPADQVKLKSMIQPVLDIGKQMRSHQTNGNWAAFREDKARFTLALYALRDYLYDLERRYSLSIDALLKNPTAGSGSFRAISTPPPPAPLSPSPSETRMVGIDIGEVRRTLQRVMNELNAAADSTADNADRHMLREAARSLLGADEPIADALMFNDIPRLRIAIATYEGKLEAMQLMMRGFEKREAERRDRARVRCAVCTQVIEGQYLKVGDKGFHKDCFRCTECRSPIGELFYTDSRGRYYCPSHPPRD